MESGKSNISKPGFQELVINDIAFLTKLENQPFSELIQLCVQCIAEPSMNTGVQEAISEFAAAQRLSQTSLKSTVNTLFTVLNGYLKRKLNPNQVQEDALSLGLDEEKAGIMEEKWRENMAVLSRSSLNQTLVVNQLVDMDWKFGELTLPQFYSFLHEMEKAKASLEHYS